MGIKSPQEIALARAQIEQSGMANKLAQLQLSESERGINDANAMRDVYKTFGADPTQNVNALYKAGLGAQALAYEKANTDRQKTASEIEKTKFETASKKFSMIGQGAGWLKDNPSIENADAVISSWMSSGVITPQEAEQKRMEFRQDPTPEGIARRALMGYQASIDAEKQLSRFETRNLGGSTDTIAINPVTGKARVVNSAVNTQSPDNRASVGASYANAAATREIASATRDAASIRRDQETEMKLGDDYRDQSKAFKEVSDAYRQINSTLDKAATSPAATLAAATKFMKLLDPGSVVRESELGMALAATGALDRAQNYFTTLKNGKVLTPSQVADFKNITGQIYGAAQGAQQAIDADYTKKAETYKLRPGMIVQDLGQNTNKNSASLPGGPLPSAIDAEIARRRGNK